MWRIRFFFTFARFASKINGKSCFRQSISFQRDFRSRKKIKLNFYAKLILFCIKFWLKSKWVSLPLNWMLESFLRAMLHFDIRYSLLVIERCKTFLYTFEQVSCFFSPAELKLSASFELILYLKYHFPRANISLYVSFCSHSSKCSELKSSSNYKFAEIVKPFPKISLVNVQRGFFGFKSEPPEQLLLFACIFLIRWAEVETSIRDCLLFAH